MCIQATIIYGSSSREKRVRIFTIQCPFSAHLQNIYQAAGILFVLQFEVFVRLGCLFNV